MNNNDQQDPPRDQLLLAYRHLCRPGWPDTLEAAMQRHSYKTAILGLARNMRRRVTAAVKLHTLPKLPAPPVAPPPAPTGARRWGRSEYSIATGPTTPLTAFARPNPLGMLARPGAAAAPAQKTRPRFDAR